MPTQKTSLQGSAQAQSSALVQGMFFVQHRGVQPPRPIVGNGTTNGVSTMPMPKFECRIAFYQQMTTKLHYMQRLIEPHWNK